MGFRDGAAALTAALLAATSSAAIAQTVPTPAVDGQATGAASAPDDGGLSDIVVTAQRRSENIQNVPIAITAIGGTSLERGTVATTEDFARNVVGLQFDRVFQSSNPTIFLRGVGVNDYNPASSGAVGVTLDEVFLNSGVGQLFQLFDVDRVEVLKGPQGTLYGRNTTGGILNFYTRQPSFATTGNVSASYGRFNQRYLDAAVGGTVIPNLVAARASFSLKQRDGWVTNRVDGRRLNDVDSLAGRLQFLVTPGDRLEMSAKVEGGRSRTSAYRAKSGGTISVATGLPCTGVQVQTPSLCRNPLTGFADVDDPDVASVNVTDNYEKLDTYDGRLGIVWTGDTVKLISITAYNWNRRRLNQDQDSSPFAILESPVWTERAWQITQEVRLSSVGTNRLNWIVGGYYLQENLHSLTDYEFLRQFNPTPALPYFAPANTILTLERDFTQRTVSRALFAQADYAVTDALTVTAGLRYTWDRKSLTFASYAGPVNEPGARLQTPLIGLIDSNPASFAIDAPVRTRDTFDKPTWRLALAYKASPDTLLYASYNRGFRSGGRNSGAAFSPIELTYVDPEKIDAYEVGAKTDLFGHTLRINTAAFYYDYRDLQVFALQPGNPVPFATLQNANAEIYGGEVEITARPVRALDLSLAAALLHTRYTRFVDPVRGTFTGNRLDKAPSLQLSGSARYTVPLSMAWSAHAGADFSYQTMVFFGPANQAPLSRGAYGLINAELGLDRPDDGLSVQLFVKNLTDKRFLQDAADTSSFGSYLLYYNEPRTYGVSANYRF